MERRSPVLARAEFHSKLKLYLVLRGSAILVASIAGIALLPFWIAIGPWWARRYIEHLECVLTERALVVKKGMLFRSERTIPLDKIQDLALKEGPILRKLGLGSLKIETAGGNSGQSGAEADLIGIRDLHAFRDRVLTQRDRVADRDGHRDGATEQHVDPSVPALLTEIRDSLTRIEGHLEATTRPSSEDGTGP